MQVTRRSALLLAATLMAHVGLLAQGEAAQSAPSAAISEIRIGAGDLLGVKVFGVPELAESARVNAAGEIVLPLLGPLPVQNMTTLEAALLIEQRLKSGSFLKHPHVTVSIAEYATQGVSILGEVQKPGIYPLLGPRRLHDAISLAGGTTPRAGKAVTITHRHQTSAPVTVELTSDPAKLNEANVEIIPGDTIVVAKAGVVYVVGDVAKPGGFLMDSNDQLSVLQVLALAGGANKTAALGRSRIIRRAATGLQDIPMPLQSMLSAHVRDVTLQADDILFVPSSPAKSAMRRSAEAILQITTGVAIYRSW